MNRVVVTGIGMVTPLAYKTNDTWQRLIEGKSGINKIVSFDTDDLNVKIAGQIPNKSNDPEGGLNVDDWIEPREDKRIDRFIAYGLISTAQAVEDSGWTPNNEN